MDSANSGSIQSSSGGDEELQSRPVDPLSAFLLRSSTAQPLPPPPLPLSLYSLPDLPPSSFPPLQPISTSPWPSPFQPPPSPSSRGTPHLPDSPPPIITTATTSSAAAGCSTPAPPRSSRKRPRASRRAPTTVLTTDTSNFRAMVQEFTGIPSPPFAPSSSSFATAAPGRFRLDHLFSSSLRSASAADPSVLAPYLLRPYAQKSSLPPSSSSSSTSINTLSPCPSLIAAIANNPDLAGPTNDNYELPSSHFGLIRTTTQQPQPLLNLPSHPTFTFQSLLQSQLLPKYDMHNLPPFGSSPPAPPPPASDLELPHGLIGSQGLHRREPAERLSTVWPRQGSDASSQLRPVVEDYTNAGMPCGCRPNYSGAAGPSEYCPEKGSESATQVAAATTRGGGEGTVDSWICTSE